MPNRLNDCLQTNSIMCLSVLKRFVGYPLIYLLLLSLISACSHNPFNKTSKLQWLLDNQRYDEAIALYPTLKEEQQASFNLQQMTTDRDTFIATSLKESRRELGKQQWLNAEAILETGLSKTPESHALKTELAVLQQRMSRLEADYLSHIQLLIAQQYIERQPLDEKWQRVTQNRLPYQHTSLSTQQRRNALANILGSRGLDLLATNTTEAKRYLNAANTLAEEPNEAWELAINSLQQKKANNAIKAQKKQQKIRELAFSDLQKNFQQHFKNNDYLKAQKSLKHGSKVAKTSAEKSWINNQQRILNSAIQEKIDASIKRGQISYSKGQIDQAISIWKQAQTLDPNNRQLKESLERAYKFKQTYESLK